MSGSSATTSVGIWVTDAASGAYLGSADVYGDAGDTDASAYSGAVVTPSTVGIGSGVLVPGDFSFSGTLGTDSIQSGDPNNGGAAAAAADVLPFYAVPGTSPWQTVGTEKYAWLPPFVPYSPASINDRVPDAYYATLLSSIVNVAGLQTNAAAFVPPAAGTAASWTPPAPTPLHYDFTRGGGYAGRIEIPELGLNPALSSIPIEPYEGRRIDQWDRRLGGKPLITYGNPLRLGAMDESGNTAFWNGRWPYPGVTRNSNNFNNTSNNCGMVGILTGMGLTTIESFQSVAPRDGLAYSWTPGSAANLLQPTPWPGPYFLPEGNINADIAQTPATTPADDPSILLLPEAGTPWPLGADVWATGRFDTNIAQWDGAAFPNAAFAECNVLTDTPPGISNNWVNFLSPTMNAYQTNGAASSTNTRLAYRRAPRQRLCRSGFWWDYDYAKMSAQQSMLSFDRRGLSEYGGVGVVPFRTEETLFAPAAPYRPPGPAPGYGTFNIQCRPACPPGYAWRWLPNDDDSKQASFALGTPWLLADGVTNGAGTADDPLQGRPLSFYCQFSPTGYTDNPFGVLEQTAARRLLEEENTGNGNDNAGTTTNGFARTTAWVMAEDGINVVTDDIWCDDGGIFADPWSQDLHRAAGGLMLQDVVRVDDSAATAYGRACNYGAFRLSKSFRTTYLTAAVTSDFHSGTLATPEARKLAAFDAVRQQGQCVLNCENASGQGSGSSGAGASTWQASEVYAGMGYTPPLSLWTPVTQPLGGSTNVTNEVFPSTTNTAYMNIAANGTNYYDTYVTAGAGVNDVTAPDLALVGAGISWFAGYPAKLTNAQIAKWRLGYANNRPQHAGVTAALAANYSWLTLEGIGVPAAPVNNSMSVQGWAPYALPSPLALPDGYIAAEEQLMWGHACKVTPASQGCPSPFISIGGAGSTYCLKPALCPAGYSYIPEMQACGQDCDTAFYGGDVVPAGSTSGAGSGGVALGTPLAPPPSTLHTYQHEAAYTANDPSARPDPSGVYVGPAFLDMGAHRPFCLLPTGKTTCPTGFTVGAALLHYPGDVPTPVCFKPLRAPTAKALANALNNPVAYSGNNQVASDSGKSGVKESQIATLGSIQRYVVMALLVMVVVALLGIAYLVQRTLFPPPALAVPTGDVVAAARAAARADAVAMQASHRAALEGVATRAAERTAQTAVSHTLARLWAWAQTHGARGSLPPNFK